jgi:hypothetical protein
MNIEYRATKRVRSWVEMQLGSSDSHLSIDVNNSLI